MIKKWERYQINQLRLTHTVFWDLQESQASLMGTAVVDLVFDTGTPFASVPFCVRGNALVSTGSSRSYVSSSQTMTKWKGKVSDVCEMALPANASVFSGKLYKVRLANDDSNDDSLSLGSVPPLSSFFSVLSRTACFSARTYHSIRCLQMLSFFVF